MFDTWIEVKSESEYKELEERARLLATQDTLDEIKEECRSMFTYNEYAGMRYPVHSYDDVIYPAKVLFTRDVDWNMFNDSFSVTVNAIFGPDTKTR